MTLTFPDPLVTSGTGDDRAAFVQGFLDLANFLATHEDAPLPGNEYGQVIVNIPVPGGSIPERLAALRSIARLIGTGVINENGWYIAARWFGPVRLEAHFRGGEFTAHLLRMFDAKQAAEKGAVAA